ncbi:MAG: polyprenyl synthetase family protein [Pseudomonadota bacterium]
MTATQQDVDFTELLAESAARAERMMAVLLPSPSGAAGDDQLFEAMRYATLGGGKRLRAFLVLRCAALFGADGAGAERVAAAIEFLHAYSLVHDDMPCMDDDDLRRGKPTVHKAYDEATAVLVGDALQALAFEAVLGPETHAEPAVRAAVALRLADASGARGMVGGQAIDLAAEKADPAAFGPDEVRRLQALKTGALIMFSAEAGGLLGRADDDALERLRAYSRDLGVAFQIADDLLDVEGDAAETGKRVGKDAAAGKATFVDILGVEGARAHARELSDRAASALAPFGASAAPLQAAAAFVVARKT